MSTQFKTKLLSSERSARVSRGLKKSAERKKAKKLLIKSLVIASTLATSIALLSNHYFPIQPALAPVDPVQASYSPSIIPIGSRTITMYTSRPEETDNTPCIGADGQDVCVLFQKGQNLCASNEFPLGTVINIDGLGDCVIFDRMNKRYPTAIDWYAGYDDDCLDGYDTYDVCPNLKRAIEFGAPSLPVSIKH